ncbi:MAG: Wzz/FepE/Etk N-terminal domain-containing protein, partial [Bacteroidota bacterium]
MAKENQTENKYDFSSTDLLIYLWEKRVPLLTISFLAAVASIIISFTITPKFRSTVVMFPTTSASISKNLLADNFSGRASMYEIGEEEQSEHLMQVLNSEEIRDRIIEKYDLKTHYEIDPD